MDSETIGALLLVVLGIVVIWPYIFPSLPDASLPFLHSQANISPVRQRGETAVYRSKSTSHGRPLLNGLSVKTEGAKPRPGTLAHIWELAQDARIAVVSADYVPRDVNYEEIKRRVSGLVKKIRSTGVTGGRIAVLLPNSLEAIIALFAISFTSNRTVLLASFEQDDVLRDALTGVDMVLCPLEAAREIKNDLPSSVKTVMYIDDTSHASHKKQKPEGSLEINGVSVVEWSSADDTSDNIEFAKISETDKAVSVVFELDNKISEAIFTHQDICAAVASQIKNLPPKQQWNSTDTVLAYTSDFSGFSIVTALAALVVNARLAFVKNHALFNPLELVQRLAPTVLVTDDETSLSLAALADELRLFGLVRLHLSKVSLSKGILPSKAILSELSSIRLIHSATYDRGKETVSQATGMPTVVHSEAANAIRSLAAARFVHALCSPVVMGPIFQTHVFDYRAKDEDAVCFGPCLPNVEAKIVDSPGHASNKNEGYVVVAGCGVHRTGDDDPGFNTKISGKWGRDGCFYLFYDRPRDVEYSYAEHVAE